MGELHEQRKGYYVETPLGVAEVKYIRYADLVELTAQLGVFQCETNEMWWWPNSEIRICGSNSAKRADYHTPIFLSSDRLTFLLPHIQRHKKSQFFWKVNDGRPQENA